MHAQIQKILSEGSNTEGFFFVLFFLLMGWREIELLLKVGHHRPASEMPLKWCFLLACR